MKKYIIIVLAVMAASMQSCNQNETIESLKAQKKEIEEKIAALEALNPDTIQREVRVKYVEVENVKAQSFKHFIEVQGVVDSENNLMITAKASGTVEGLKVKEGDRVKKGQILAQIDDKIIRNSISELNSSLEFATEMYNKQKSLWDQKIGSEVQYLQAKNQKESLEGRLATLREQLKMTRITSPINGTIDQVFIKEGEVAGPGMPVVRVVNLKDFEVKAQVAENYALAVKEGTSVKIYFPDLKQEVDAKINFVGNVIDPLNRTFNVVIRFNNPDIGIKPNMVSVVKIQDYSSETDLIVPVNAVIRSNEGEYVFVAEENGEVNIARKVDVKTELSYNGMTVIRKGLEENDKLVTFGFQNLVDGQPIEY